MLAGLRKLAKGLLFGADGSLSSSRTVIFLVLLEINGIVILACAWIYHVTITNQMEQAAPLAQAVFTGVAAVLGSQALMAAINYAAQYKWGPGSYSGRQSDIDEARAAIVAGEEPAYIPEIGPEIVPSDPDEPRVAAETASTDAVELKTTEPLDVAIVEDDLESNEQRNPEN